MTPSLIVSYDENILTSVELWDSTDNISGIKAVRIMFGTVNSVNDAQTTSDLEAWREYTADQSTTINGVTYATGDKIYLANATTITGTATETGFYGERVTWLPSDGGYVSFSPTQTGDKGNNLIFRDSVFTVNYEVYTTQYAAGTIAAGTYIVKGTAGQYITIGSETYYVGEVFTKGTSFTFTGTPDICEYAATGTIYFVTTAQAFDVLQSYIVSMAANMNNNAAIMNNMLDVLARYNTTDLSANQQQ